MLFESIKYRRYRLDPQNAHAARRIHIGLLAGVGPNVHNVVGSSKPGVSKIIVPKASNTVPRVDDIEHFAYQARRYVAHNGLPIFNDIPSRFPEAGKVHQLPSSVNNNGVSSRAAKVLIQIFGLTQGGAYDPSKSEKEIRRC